MFASRMPNNMLATKCCSIEKNENLTLQRKTNQIILN